MKILAKNFIKIYNSISNFSKINLPINQAYKIYLLNQEFKKHYEFLLEKEKNLFSQYNITIDENGKLNYSNEEDFEKFEQEYENLYRLELTISIDEPIEMNIKNLNETVQISSQDIENLSDFIIFKEE